jgi:hypothetical protein
VVRHRRHLLSFSNGPPFLGYAVTPVIRQLFLPRPFAIPAVAESRRITTQALACHGEKHQ